jgi:EthD domain
MDFKLIYLARRNPSISPEDWPRTWRSHAVFVSQFPTVSASVGSLFYCSRMREPMLNGAPFNPPEASLDYDGVAVVGSASADTLLRGAMSPETRAKIDQDELRVFSTYTPSFSFHCKELLVHGGAAGQAAVIRFLARKAGTSREAFFGYLSGPHRDLARRAADAARTVIRYVHNGVTDEPPVGYPFDAITESWFASTDHAVHSFVDEAFAPLTDDLPAFCDMTRTVTLLTSVVHRWPRA